MLKNGMQLERKREAKRLMYVKLNTRLVHDVMDFIL